MYDEIFTMDVTEPYTEFLNDVEKSMARFIEEKDKRLERLKKLLNEVCAYYVNWQKYSSHHLCLIN